MSALRRLLAEPRTRGLSLDDPRTTLERRRILREKESLRRIYTEWYDGIVERLPGGPGSVLELGSGAGFLAERVPGIVTSEVVPLPGVRAVLDARRLPVASASLRAIVMTDVLHHVPDVRAFFAEAIRVLRPGGVVAMVEPWRSRWSSLVYRYLHHEPFEPGRASWEFPSRGPLADANGALPWIVFERDREVFEREYPALRLASIEPLLPFRYLLSGGVSTRALLPSPLFPVVAALERRLLPACAMFARIVLVREPRPGRVTIPPRPAGPDRDGHGV